MTSKTISRLAEFTIVPILIVSVLAWGDLLDWNLKVSRQSIFPLLGLIAFSTMWWHFFTGFMQRVVHKYYRYDRLHELSGYWVFISFIMHPALLIWYANDLGYSALNFFNGDGLLPQDFYREFYNGSERFIVLGYISLIGFLAFDIGRVMRRKLFVQKNWHIVEALSDAAFIAIFIHSLQLGRHLQSGWFRGYWILLGLSGIGFILQRYYFKFRHETIGSHTT